MKFTHLQKIRRAFPDQAVTVITWGRDLPDDVLVARPDVGEAFFTRVRKAFADHS